MLLQEAPFGLQDLVLLLQEPHLPQPEVRDCEGFLAAASQDPPNSAGECPAKPQSPDGRLLLVILSLEGVWNVESQANVGAMGLGHRRWLGLEVGESRRTRGAGNSLTTPNHADVW